MAIIPSFSSTETIEPDTTPSTPPPKYPTSGRTATPPAPYININYDPPSASTANTSPRTMQDWKSYLPSFSLVGLSREDKLRRIACTAVLVINVPINLLWVIGKGFGVFVPLWILLALLNFFCVAIGLARLESMVGHRNLFSRTLTRTHFDYMILFILFTYILILALIIMAYERIFGGWVLLHAMWPCLIIANLVCYFGGWMAGWRDGMSLG